MQEILDAVDENNDGEITREEFVENALKSDFIKNLVGDQVDRRDCQKGFAGTLLEKPLSIHSPRTGTKVYYGSDDRESGKQPVLTGTTST